jgi:hypothetical protein
MSLDGDGTAKSLFPIGNTEKRGRRFHGVRRITRQGPGVRDQEGKDPGNERTGEQEWRDLGRGSGGEGPGTKEFRFKVVSGTARADVPY